MNIIDGISLLIGRIVIGMAFFGIGIYLIGAICDFFKNPHCPKCGSRKIAAAYGNTAGGYHCEKCGQYYWHKGLRNYIENPDKK